MTEALKSKGRCHICTLQVPCKHVTTSVSPAGNQVTLSADLEVVNQESTRTNKNIVTEEISNAE